MKTKIPVLNPIMCFLIIITLLVIPITSVDSVKATSAKVGLLVDSPIDDAGWSQLAYEGLVKAETDWGITKAVYIATGDPIDYGAAVNACIAAGNGLCIGVGWGFSDPLAAAASSNPTIKFAILGVDVGDTPPSNLRGVRFKEKEVGYLAGALAGKMTASNTVGAVGGMAIPVVVDFVEGYENGAQCANASVIVLKQYTGNFNNPDDGAAAAEDMINNNADVIFAAAGNTGNGAILYAGQHDKWAIGVDTDQYYNVFGGGSVDGADMLLTSAMLRLDNAVYGTIYDFLNPSGTFGGNVYYGINEGGVGLAPYHETDDDIPDGIKTYISDLETKIKNGTISVNVTCYLPGTFSKTSPANGATNRPPSLTLKWGKSTNVASYEYCYDKTNDNKCGTGWKSAGTSISKTITGLTAGKYYWQVNALNARGKSYANNGIWWSFTIPPKPGAFNKIIPLNNAVKQPTILSLKWGVSSNAFKYEYCIDTTAGTTCTTSWKSTNLNRFVNLTGLLKGKKYYWTVRAVNSMGTTLSNGGVWWNFTTKP